MRKSTLSAMALMLACSVGQAFAYQISQEVNLDKKCITYTFEDATTVIPAQYLGINGKAATFNGEDASWSMTVNLSDDGQYTNSFYYTYMFYSAALSNGFQLPDGEYTMVFEPGFLVIDGTPNEENIEVTTVIGAAAPAGPAVSMEIVDVTSSTFELQFTPNEAADSYYLCLFDHGTFEEQYAMWSAWMGFQAYGDMIKAWGLKRQGVSVASWDKLAPNTTYDIWVQPCDAEGNYGEAQCFEVTTLGQGGEGLSEIAIEIGVFGGDENGHYQEVIYTPNDQTAVYFDMICTHEWYEQEGIDGVKAYLMEENDPTDPYFSYYAHYDVDDALWMAEEGVTYHAFALGLNGKDEWGTLAEVVFTTPGGEVHIESVRFHDVRTNGSYNLQGQKMGDARGFMIQEGQKVLVK